MLSILASIRGPQDLRNLDAGELPRLASEIRGYLVAAVSRNGGHLGPNLGVIELTSPCTAPGPRAANIRRTA